MEKKSKEFIPTKEQREAAESCAYVMAHPVYKELLTQVFLAGVEYSDQQNAELVEALESIKEASNGVGVINQKWLHEFVTQTLKDHGK